MRQSINFRFAALEIPAVLNSKDPESSAPPIIKYMNYFRYFNCNITFDGGNTHFGVLVDGKNYDGILGQLQRNLTDTSIVYLDLDVKDDQVHFGPAVDERRNVIYSFTKPIQHSYKDVITQINVFEADASYCILFVLICMITIQHLRRKFSFNDFLTMIFAQNHDHKNSTQKTNFLFVTFIFLINLCIQSNFCTNLSVIIAPFKLASLRDLGQSDVRPIFFKVFPLYTYFRDNFTQDYANVWKRAENTGLNNSLFDERNMIDGHKLVTEAMACKAVLLTTDIMVVPLLKTLCGILSKPYKTKYYKNEQRMFISPEFIKNLVAFPHRRGLNEQMIQRVYDFSYGMIEFGFSQYFIRSFEYMTSFEDDGDCCRRLTSPLPTNNFYASLKLLNFHQSLITASLLLFLITSLLCYENIHFRKRRHSFVQPLNFQ